MIFLNKSVRFLNEELFAEDKIDFINMIIGMEINAFLTKDQRKKIGEVRDVAPETIEMLNNAIDEVHRKHIYEARKMVEKKV